MSPLELFRAWLNTIVEVAAVQQYMGHWLSYDNNKEHLFVCYQGVGGADPRELNTRMINYSLTVVGSVDGALSAVNRIAEAIAAHCQLEPKQCEIVTVNMLGEPIGPLRSDAGRPLFTLTVQMII